jgi:Ca2+-binding RTX toxin-like protein
MTILVTSKIRVVENTRPGTVVGSILATSDDPQDTFTFTVTGGGPPGFELVGNKVVVAAGAILDFETWPDYAIAFTVTNDRTGESLFSAAYIRLIDQKGITIRETTDEDKFVRGFFNATSPSEKRTLHGTNENDHLAGGSGNDHIFGLGGYDVLFGGQGNDVLVGGPGWDRMRGGPGADRFLKEMLV